MNRVRSLLKTWNRSAILVIALLIVLLVLPSSNLHVFNGLPFSSPPELMAAVLIAPLLVSPGVRRLLRNLLFKRHPILGVSIIAICLVGVVLKLLISVSGVYSGFLGCYRSTLTPPVSGRCEKSYENAMQDYGITRLDDTLDFEENDWNMSFVNSVRFNFYAWEDGTILRERLPIEVDWLTRTNLSDLGQMRITYVGEATVRMDSEVVSLPPTYDRMNSTLVTVPTGAADLNISYRFDDGYRVSDQPPIGPSAIFSVDFIDLEGDLARTLAFGDLSLGWLIAGKLVDALVVAILSALAGFYLILARRDLWILLLIGSISILVYCCMPELGPITRERSLLLCLSALYILLAIKPRRSRLLVAYLAVFLIVVLRSLLFHPDLDYVSVRPGGTDPLTYESQARSILDTFSLRGDEDIFFGQVFFRYILFSLHLFFGDADAYVAIPALTALNFAIFYLVYRYIPAANGQRAKRFVVIVGGLAALALVNAWHTVWLVHYGVSEYPTWILTLIALPLLFSTKTSSWALGALSLGLAWITRTNQALAILVVMAAHLLWIRRLGRGNMFWLSGTIFLAILLLPGIHNLYYGGQFIPAPTYWDNRTNMVLHPQLLARFFIEQDVRLLALRQIEGLALIGRDFDTHFGALASMRVLQVVWLAAVFYAIPRWRSMAPDARLLILAPIAYLAVQFLYNLYGDTYPRHLIMPYLAMGIVSMYAFSSRAKVNRGARR